MKVKNTTRSALFAALDIVNEEYAGNITFQTAPESLNKKETRFSFRLSVIDSKESGARRSATGRRIAAACWHVHGDFFEALISITPTAEIRTAGGVINAAGGNWQDRNIGSYYQPLMHSEACECNS